MGRWTIARVDDAHVATFTSNEANAIAPDSLTAYAAVRMHPLAPSLATYLTRKQVNRELLAVWFSESGQRRLRDTRDRLLRCP